MKLRHMLSLSPALNQREMAIKHTAQMHSEMYEYGAERRTSSNSSLDDSCVIDKYKNYDNDSSFHVKFEVGDVILTRY